MKKEEVIELVELFGLYVDLDRWDQECGGWLRIQSGDWPEDFGYKNNCLIIYKEDVDSGGARFVKDELVLSLINLGKNLKAKEMRNILNIA